MMIVKRYWWKTLVLLVILAGYQLINETARMSLQDPVFITGFSLLACVLFLTLFNIRKKFPMIPLGRVATWTHLHILVGWLSVGLFLLHIGFHVPDGGLEILLAVLFFIVAVSGIVGALISKAYPRFLTNKGQEVIFERIPNLRKQLRNEAETLIFQSVEQTGATTIADFYADRIQSFFEGPKNQFSYLISASGSQTKLAQEMQAVCRYLDEKGQAIIQELSDIVKEKDALDYHQALQTALKTWLFVHIPLTYSMIVVALLHMVLALGYTGGFF